MSRLVTLGTKPPRQYVAGHAALINGRNDFGACKTYSIEEFGLPPRVLREGTVWTFVQAKGTDSPEEGERGTAIVSSVRAKAGTVQLHVVLRSAQSGEAIQNIDVTFTRGGLVAREKEEGEYVTRWPDEVHSSYVSTWTIRAQP